MRRFHIQSHILFEKRIWNHFHIKCEDLQTILDFSFHCKKKKVPNQKNVALGHFQFFSNFSHPILYIIRIMHLGSFSYQMWRFKSYFGLFICLQKEKSSKLKKRRAGTFSIFLVFFTSNPIYYLKKCIWDHFHIKCEDLKAILDFSFAYNKKKVQNSKNVAPGHFQFFSFFSHPILSIIWKMHLESFSYQMWRFGNYFGLFIPLQEEKNSKFKKRRAGTFSIF